MKPHSQDVKSPGPEFLRIKHRPGTRDILVENTSRGKYFINIDTQEVREATPADFPPPAKREPPPDVPPIEFNGMWYIQIMNGLKEGRDLRCGLLAFLTYRIGCKQIKFYAAIFKL